MNCHLVAQVTVTNHLVKIMTHQVRVQIHRVQVLIHRVQLEVLTRIQVIFLKQRVLLANPKKDCAMLTIGAK